MNPKKEYEVNRLDDNLIIDLFWKRSETAIAQAALKYGKYCKSIAYNILYNNEDVEECINDTYMKAWNSIPPKKPNSLGAYLAKITRNLSLNKYKQKNASKRNQNETELIFNELEDCIPTANTTESECEMNLLTEQINAFLKTLKDENQIIFVRRYWYSDSISSISERLKISESKVKSILFRCREKLKKYLEKEGVVI